MNRLQRGFQAAAVCAALGALAAPAGAATLSSFTFNGNCEDCAAAAGTASYAVSALLVLQDYSGGALSDANFVSFEYSGSNLMDAYYVFTGGDASVAPAGFNWVHSFESLNGDVSGTGAAQKVELRFGDGLEFSMPGNGNFYTCGGKGEKYYAAPCSWQTNSDTGTGSFTSPLAAAVPEPGTYALLGLGLAAVALRRRKTAA